MTVEEYFEEWWTPKELPENGFNKIAMLDFAEMYHKQALRIHDVVGQSEQLVICKKCGSSEMYQYTKTKDKCEECGNIQDYDSR